MIRYDVYYETKDKRIEKKNLSRDEMQEFLDNLNETDNHLLRVNQVKNRERDEEER